jgi:hypothetical protein
MKKSVLVLGALLFLMSYPLESQGLLNKVKNAVSKDVSGNNNKNVSKPEPKCACSNAKIVIDLGKYTIVYEEITICTKDDGSILIYDKVGSKYYISRDGKSEGPYTEGNPKIAGFCSDNDEGVSNEKADALMARYPEYISMSGEKYLIKFGGKNYGPYAIINDFAVSSTKDKFAAIVTENVMVTEDQGKKMEEAMKNAKTDQERMDIAMKMGQQMQNQMMQGGGAGSIQPKMVSNIPGATYDMMTWMGGRLNSRVKLGDILVVASDRILDLKGKTIMKRTESNNSADIFINTNNTRYAFYNYGTLTFDDNTTLSELFNPYLTKTDGKEYLNYMYYSPGKDAIMQCAIPF